MVEMGGENLIEQLDQLLEPCRGGGKRVEVIDVENETTAIVANPQAETVRQTVTIRIVEE